MSYRYSNTDKWKDSWYFKLRPIEKLLFNYLCDNCDCAGFIEVIIDDWAKSIGTDKKTIQGALKGLDRGLINSNEKDCVYIRTFLRHQKNIPLNPEKNNSHRGILARFEMYKYKFNIDINNLEEFISQSLKGLGSPYGNGNGNGNGNNKKGVENFEKTWRNDFETYLEGIREFWRTTFQDSEYLKQQERLHPNVNIKLSIEKACVNYWATEAGWKQKKSKKIKEIDWKSTLTNAIDLNKVYNDKNAHPNPTVYRNGKSENPGKFRKGVSGEPSILGYLMKKQTELIP